MIFKKLQIKAYQVLMQNNLKKKCSLTNYSLNGSLREYVLK